MAKWLTAATAAGGEGEGVENISSLISSAIFQVLTPMCIEKANDLIAVSRSQVTQAGSEERGGEGGSGNRRGGGWWGRDNTRWTVTRRGGRW